eukprot:sb/3467910/
MTSLWDQLFPQFYKAVRVCHIIIRGYTALMIRRNIVNILTCLRWVWAVYKRGILLLLLLLLYDANPLHIYCVSDWTAVEKDVKIPWDLEGTPLQLKTDSKLGSGQIMRVEMYKNDSSSYVGGVEMRLSSLVRYRIYHCINSYTDLPVELPVEVEKIWTIIKTGTALIITCNNVEVLNYLFADSSNTKCVKKLGGDVVEMFKFHGWDAASDFYRAAPECPAFTVEGSTEGIWTASLTGTTATIECDATHILIGTLTCQEDGSWSSDVPQCDKIGKKLETT